MMFRLLRLPILLFVAFAAGIYFERSQRHEACLDMGGIWSAAGFCTRE
jgi:hypothetical protein